MIYRLLVIVLVTLAAMSIGGCKKQAEPVQTTDEVSEVEVTEENLDAELDKMEEQINADIAAEEQ